jgi:hypothetical protein
MITKDQAVTANEFHHATETQASGKQCLRVRRNGHTQTWKTRPAEWRLPVKWGLHARGQFSIMHTDAANWHTAETCPRAELH